MDYSEMLFAYHVRKEALERIREEMAPGTTREDFQVMYEGIISDIVSSTQAMAYQIRVSADE